MILFKNIYDWYRALKGFRKGLATSIIVILSVSLAELIYQKSHNLRFISPIIILLVVSALIGLITKIILVRQFRSFLFIVPALAIFSIFYIYPFIKVLQLGHYNWDGILPTMKFVGLYNFIEVMKDKVWWQSMFNAGYITFIALTFQNALALILALACDRQMKAGNFYRIIFFIPPVLSAVVVGLVWQWLYDGDYGLLNHWLYAIGFPNLARSWLSDPKTALTCVAIVHSWKGFGWGFVILLAGLQTIPHEFYEAARVEGANSWQVFKGITVPLMIPVFVLVAILTVLGSMQSFVLILTMTDGGPVFHTVVPVTRILNSMIGSSRFGYACSQSIIFGAILLAISFIQKRVSQNMRQA
ncbi:MAG: sugar ABC transporter permease [Candidatus Omnitrophica bacterium]|nr:sugar ABC transporter permease [Candidatus Omnitrophota bacterium]